MSNRFANTKILAFFILRKDRIRILIWIISIVLFTVMIGAMLPNLYSTGTDRQIMAETMKNPAITVMLGPGYGLDNYTDGAMMAHFMLIFTLLAVGIMNILMTIRNTREDEEEGRTEIIRSLPSGFLSPLTAAFFVSAAANTVLALTAGLSLYSLGFESMDFQGSMLYGASIGTAGIFFTSLTALFAQLTPITRSALGYSFGFLILAYIIRGIGDVESELLSLFSPLGLILRTEVYVNNHWWPVLLTLGLSVILAGLAMYLNTIRDLGAGFLQPKSGKAEASRFLSSPLGLALRLQRTAVISWTIGMLVLGLSYGSVLGDLEGFLDSSGLLLQMLPESEVFNLTERFVGMLLTILSILAAIPVLIFILKLKSEENAGRIEQLLAGAVSRTKLIGSYAFIGLAAAPVIQFMSVLGLWASAAFVMEDPLSFNILLKASMAYIPSVWVMAGLMVLAIGYLPRFTGAVWLYLGYAFFIAYLGDMLKLPEWMDYLSPFGHIPQIPLEEFHASKTLLSMLLALISKGCFMPGVSVSIPST
jgi:ABC-2 type transport system permease protein